MNKSCCGIFGQIFSDFSNSSNVIKQDLEIELTCSSRDKLSSTIRPKFLAETDEFTTCSLMEIESSEGRGGYLELMTTVTTLWVTTLWVNPWAGVLLETENS